MVEGIEFLRLMNRFKSLKAGCGFFQGLNISEVLCIMIIKDRCERGERNYECLAEDGFGHSGDIVGRSGDIVGRSEGIVGRSGDIVGRSEGIVGRSAVNLSDISRELCVSKPAVSQIVNKLEWKRLIRRVRNKQDKKIVNLELTQKARNLFEKESGKNLGLYRTIVEEMGGDLQTFVACSEKLLSIMQKYYDETQTQTKTKSSKLLVSKNKKNDE